MSLVVWRAQLHGAVRLRAIWILDGHGAIVDVLAFLRHNNENSDIVLHV